MKYLYPSFTLPTVSKDVSARQWDFATLTKAEFVLKYGEHCEEYPAPLTAVEQLDVIDALLEQTNQ